MTPAAPATSLSALRQEAAHCHACPLWKGATQTVFGEGPQNASALLVGEQKALVTVHPSYLLRLPDAQAKAREYAHFVDDLRIAAALIKKSARAA